MKLAELILNAQELLYRFGDVEVWQSSDPEGNSIRAIDQIAYIPSVVPSDNIIVIWPTDEKLNDW
jgi:hypothetical protein